MPQHAYDINKVFAHMLIHAKFSRQQVKMNIANVPDSSTEKFESTMDRATSEAEAMSAANIVHSNYVPAQLHRQLQFLDHNVGTYRNPCDSRYCILNPSPLSFNEIQSITIIA